MKRIKNYNQYINEFFDTEELRAEYEIPYLSGTLPLRKMVADVKTPSEFEKISGRLGINFPFFLLPKDNYHYAIEDPKLAFHYIFKNENWFIHFSIHQERENCYNVGIGYNGVNLKFTEKDIKLIYGKNRGDKNPNECITEVYENNTWEEVENLIKTRFIPIMREFGFGALLSVKPIYPEYRKN